MTGNPIFPAIVEGMFGWLGEYYRDLVRVPGAENLTIAEHGRILEAISARDADAAEAAMYDHVSRASELYRALEQPGRGGRQPRVETSALSSDGLMV